MIFVYPGTLVFQDFLLHYVIIFLLVSRKCRHSSFHEGILHFFFILTSPISGVLYRLATSALSSYLPQIKQKQNS